MLVRPIWKPPKKKKHKAKNNPAPTDQSLCRYTKRPYASTHEIYYGRGKRQLSIKYGMQIKVCEEIHRMIHKNKSLDKALKRKFQRIFEETHTRDEFLHIFGRSYLESEVLTG
jgi:hypothetical protein